MSWVASVYHRLAFRGLLAEGLGELGLHQPRVLSLAAWSLSNAGDAARGTAAASRFAAWDRLGCAAATGVGQAFFGAGFLVAGRRTVLVRSSIPIPRAGVGTNTCPAAGCGISPLQEAG